MITGWLSLARFGLWEVILSFVAISSYPAGWLTFWATRDVARGKFVAKSAIFLNLALSFLGVGVYFAACLVTGSLSVTNYSAFLLAVLLVPLSYWGAAANAIAAGHRPSAFGYSILFAEVGKLVVAYPVLFVLKLEITGVILAMMASYAIQAVATTLLVRGATKDPISLDVGRRWLRDSWVPATYSLAGAVLTADTVSAYLVSGAYVLSGYFQAAYQVGILVSYAGFLSYAMYPLLLRGGSEDAPSATLDLILMFGAPMAAGVIALAPTLLRVLSASLVAGGANVSLGLQVLAFAGLVSAVSSFSDSTLIGRERADLDPDKGFARYLKSAFWFVSAVNIGYAAGYLVSVTLIVYFGTASGLNISAIVTAWSVALLGFLVVATAIKLRRLKGRVRLSLTWSLGWYFSLSALMALLIYFISGWLLPPIADRFLLGFRTMGVVAIGAAFYFSLLLILDRRVRGMALQFLEGSSVSRLGARRSEPPAPSAGQESPS
ncbi:MAG: hypothetical protein OK438_03975 [Thaumarchaeota archaeon]|nr:hypothetical protein [Nitrososphaerota archaeon]